MEGGQSVASRSLGKGRGGGGYLKDSTDAQLGKGSTEAKLHEEKK